MERGLPDVKMANYGQIRIMFCLSVSAAGANKPCRSAQSSGLFKCAASGSVQCVTNLRISMTMVVSILLSFQVVLPKLIHLIRIRFNL